MTTPSPNIAEDMANLIDGYCRMVMKTEQSLIVRPQQGTYLYTDDQFYYDENNDNMFNVIYILYIQMLHHQL